jgi:L-iditol 2-dehydrogenase
MTSSDIDAPSTRRRIRTTHPNQSLQVTPDNKIKLVENPVYAPGPGEVLLHVKVTGICGYAASLLGPGLLRE